MTALRRRTEAEIRLLEQLGQLRQFHPKPGGKAELVAELELRRLERVRKPKPSTDKD